MTFDALAASLQDSQPREFARIVYGPVVHQISFSNRDMVIDAGTTTEKGVSVPAGIYTVIAGARGKQVVTGAGKLDAMELTLPINHALAKRWLTLGVPPFEISAAIWCQEADGSIKQVWDGPITSMGWSDDCTEANFRIPSRLSAALERKLPILTAGRKCPHTLYGPLCRVDPNGSNPDGIPYKCSATVLAIEEGRKIRLDLTTVPAAYTWRKTWLKDGRLEHPASGDKQSILDQSDDDPGVGTTCLITLQFPVVGMVVGDAIDVYAGCDWTNPMCKSKFNNLMHHWGFTFMPYNNPFVPGFPVDEE